MEQYELIKVQCRAIILVKEGDKVLREDAIERTPGEGISCYSIEDMAEFYARARAEVDAKNEKNKPNRSQRRKT